MMQYAVDTLAKYTANATDKSHIYEQYDIRIVNMYKKHHPQMFTGEFIPHVTLKPMDVEPAPFDLFNATESPSTNKRKIDEVDLDIDETL